MPMLGATMADDEECVTQWIKDLGSANRDEAFRRLWESYFPRLVKLAEARLRSVPCGPDDEEDVALSALKSFFRGAAAGRFPDLGSRNDLWKLLVTITARKARKRWRDEHRQKRGGGRVVHEADLAGAGQAGHEVLFDLVSSEPTPEFAAMMTEECQRLFAALADETHRVVALLKLEGRSNEEIAKSLECGVSTVERKLRVIRKRWLTEETS
jgi:RNA polymerase sigma factor (sigma-70 family)